MVKWFNKLQLASNQEPEQPKKKKKKRIRSKNKDEPIPGAFDLSAILNSQQTFPLSNNMNGQPYMNNNTNFHNMSMPMMSSPFVTSPTQQFQMGAPYMPWLTPTQASPPQWATELLSKFEAMSVKMNSGPLDVAIANSEKEKMKFSNTENVKSQNHDSADVMNENGMQVS
ncbi:Hypothetical predicted protein [Mytilus galloprovincialis]|uniref:Uncharacterized protein n=1 Tax=Mytilus galloprovincialis TaxID=29158 RepID=A0A8B6EBR3_MYTGA|nr:Hypothetical predicted protein [Mytilus galloprovincialis]